MSKFDIGHNCLFGFDYIQYTKECTEMSSVDVRICVGIFGEAGSGQGYGNALAGLDQIQFDGPFDSRPASLDIEFTVDALGMSADCA